VVDAGADAAGKDETAIGIVIAEQQSAEKRPRAAADHHEFLTVQAFDLEPQPAVAKRVGRMGTFRHDALERHRARLLMKFPAAADLVITVVQG